MFLRRGSDNSLTASSPHTQCSWENAWEGGEAWDRLQVLHPSSFRCHTATSPSLAGRRTTGQKAIAAPSHRLRVTIHRGVALADPDYLPGSEAWRWLLLVVLVLVLRRCVSRYVLGVQARAYVQRARSLEASLAICPNTLETVRLLYCGG